MGKHKQSAPTDDDLTLTAFDQAIECTIKALTCSKTTGRLYRAPFLPLKITVLFLFFVLINFPQGSRRKKMRKFCLFLIFPCLDKHAILFTGSTKILTFGFRIKCFPVLIRRKNVIWVAIVS